MLNTTQQVRVLAWAPLPVLRIWVGSLHFSTPQSPQLTVPGLMAKLSQREGDEE